MQEEIRTTGGGWFVEVHVLGSGGKAEDGSSGGEEGWRRADSDDAGVVSGRWQADQAAQANGE